MSQPELRPTSARVLTGCLVAGLIAGWVSHRLADAWLDHAPVVTWGQPLLLLVMALLLGGVAWSTWRTVHVHRVRLEPHRAVNRLVLARACAVVGALAAGLYLGYAVSWLGVDAELAHQRLVRSLLAGVSGGLITGAALLLERACRVRPDDDES
ncbi:MAG: DUF3180 domain-containing protein [Nocardioides sp.]|uniref:DUF3180 domain-containing protein n=1 Tax=Nocardioides sp. TaxID=35761 RepID=UPI0039E5E717